MEENLSSLITQLHKYIPFGEEPIPNALKFVIDYQRFVHSLEKINNMIGLDTVKKQIALQIKSFMANYRLYGNPTNNEKLHTLLYGPPGCGKTQLGCYLAELWSSSGCLSDEGSEKLFKYAPEEDGGGVLKMLNYEITIADLTQEIGKTKREIEEIIGDFLSFHRKINRSKVIDRFYIRNRISKFKDRLSSLYPDRKTSPPQRSVKFSIVTRGDLIGKYQGHTTAQVREILKQNIGGVLMIDEAYNLCTSNTDSFGKEALTEIISFMTTWPNKIIFIFAGYRNLIEESILKYQPGLSRRFNWTFEIAGYTSAELAGIFISQIKCRSWEIPSEDSDKIVKFFHENKEKFPYFGGDTEKLCSFVRDAHYQNNWIKVLDDTNRCDELSKLFKYIDYSIIKIAFSNYLNNSTREKEDRKQKESFQKIQHMYI